MTDHPRLTMGDHSYSDGRVDLRCNLSDVIVGKFCSIAKGVVMDCGFQHNPRFVSSYPFNVLMPQFGHLTGHPVTKGDIVIGNDVVMNRCGFAHHGLGMIGSPSPDSRASKSSAVRGELTHAKFSSGPL